MDVVLEDANDEKYNDHIVWERLFEGLTLKCLWLKKGIFI